MVGSVISALAYIIIGPILGGLLQGIDRKLTARLQGRQGPPLLQPFYDLWRSSSQDFEAFVYYADRLAVQIEKGQEKPHDHEVL